MLQWFAVALHKKRIPRGRQKLLFRLDRKRLSVGCDSDCRRSVWAHQRDPTGRWSAAVKCEIHARPSSDWRIAVSQFVTVAAGCGEHRNGPRNALRQAA